MTGYGSGFMADRGTVGLARSSEQHVNNAALYQLARHSPRRWHRPCHHDRRGRRTGAYDCSPEDLAVDSQRPQGLSKFALRTGADLVPVLAFGENDLYSHVNSEKYPLIQKIQRLVKNMTGWELPLLYGQGFRSRDLGLLAYRMPIDIMVGRPIEVGGKMEEPAVEEIGKAHGLYMEELERM